jgi:hypothetical protein
MACASVPSSSWRIASVSTATCRRRSPKTSSCPCGSAKADLPGRQRGNVDERTNITFTAEQRLDWLRLIRSENIGPCGIVAQTPPTPARVEGRRGRARGCSSGPGSWVLGLRVPQGKIYAPTMAEMGRPGGRGGNVFRLRRGRCPTVRNRLSQCDFCAMVAG